MLDVVTTADPDSGEGRSYLLVLDARTMLPYAELPLPSHVPYQSHGNWFPSAEVAESAPGYHVQRPRKDKQETCSSDAAIDI